jgi:hypothetical protein
MEYHGQMLFVFGSNWLCLALTPLIFDSLLGSFGFELALNWVCIGFVFSFHQMSIRCIYLSLKSLAKFAKLDFGFVLQKKDGFVEFSLQL